jgi:integrase
LRAKLPREGHREPRVIWTPEDLDVFIEHASGHRLHAFYRIAAFTGGRRGEILHLRWADVDLDAAEIRFEGSTSVVDGQRINGSTKGGRSRVVGIDQGTIQVLEKHRLAQEADRSLAGPEWVESDLVFTSQLGHLIHPDTFTWLMHKLIKAHNEPKTVARRNHPSEPLPPPARELPMIRLHDLRHLHATLLLLEGVPVHVVANRLGHSDPSVTLRVYAHVLRESASGVADIFARAVERTAVSKSVSKRGPEDDETRRPSL